MRTGQDETGHGDAQRGADHHGIVYPGILVPGRRHAGQDAGADGQEQADNPQLSRHGEGFGNDIVDGLAGILIRRAQIEDGRMADVVDILGPQGFVEVISGFDGRHDGRRQLFFLGKGTARDGVHEAKGNGNDRP